MGDSRGKKILDMLKNAEKQNKCSDESQKEYRNDVSPSHEVFSFLQQPSGSQAITIEASTTDESTFLPESSNVTKGEFLVEANNNNSLTIRIRRKAPDLPNYYISPIHSNESDVDHTDSDPTYNLKNNTKMKSHFLKNISTSAGKSSPLTSSSSSSSSTSSTSSSSSESECSDEEKAKKGRKRSKNPEKWKQNNIKKLRNCGKSYTSMSKSKKEFPARGMKATCPEKCRLKCAENIDTESRMSLFTTFWALGDLSRQRAFIHACMKNVIPKYKYTNAERPRNANKAFYFTIKDKPVKVCKTFFRNTLDISDRMIRTVAAKLDENGFLQVDNRGKHDNHRQFDESLVKDIKNHINSIPRIQSHYIRSNTQREFIEGGKSVADLFRDFQESQKMKNKDAGKYCTYYNIFTTEFNIGFFQPKKDQCDLCLSYDNATEEAKVKMGHQYKTHLEQKNVCRQEKQEDRRKISEHNKVVVYDLQAVLQCPRGDTSAFYYKSKLNSYNFTIVELAKKEENVKQRDQRAYKNAYCFYWNEVEAKRGAIEIGSCILQYFDKLFSNNSDLEREGLDITFYSDNCCGQNKNKYIVSVYLYVVNKYHIKTLTHKFLIKGHSQNEGDNVHSIIEKEVKKHLKSGPIYSAHQYVTLIRNARKSKPPFTVKELTNE